jgi:hypothetical protein
MFAACCHDAILRSIVPFTSAVAGIFEAFELIEVEIANEIVVFRHRYLEGDAAADPRRIPSIKLITSDLNTDDIE